MKKKKQNDGVRIITKYPNRRLYDRTASTYIPFADIKELILKNIPFKVIDQKTEEDVTRIVLTQMIAEESSQNNSVFSETLLRQIIQFYGNSMGGVLSIYLENAMGNFVAMHNQVVENLTVQTLNTKFNGLLEDSAKRNQEYFTEMQKLFLSSLRGDIDTKQ